MSIEILLPKYNRRLLHFNSPAGSVPGNRKFVSVSMIDSLGNADSIYMIDNRDNTIQVLGGPSTNFDKWIYKRFGEYKESNFKFGNDMYEPTEQIEVEQFFNYLKSCLREEVIDSIK